MLSQNSAQQILSEINSQSSNNEYKKIQFNTEEFEQMPQMDQISSQEIEEESKKFEYQLIFQSEVEKKRICYAIVFNSDASMVYFGDWNKIRVFEFKDQKLKQVQCLTDHSNFIICLVYMKKSDILISGSWDKTIKIWKQNNDGKWIVKQTLLGHDYQIQCLTFNKNEDMIVSGSQDEQIKIWKLNNNSWSEDQSIKCSSQIWSLDINESGTKLISCDDGSESIKVFELNDSKWILFQIINTIEIGIRLCFVSDTDFVFLPEYSDHLQFFNLNKAINQFQIVDVLDIQDPDIDYAGFPIAFIKSQNLLIVKNDKFVNVIRRIDDMIFILDQQIEFESNKTYGSVSSDGQYLITRNDDTKILQIRKLVQ